MSQNYGFCTIFLIEWHQVVITLKSEAKLTFFEATAIIVGHGVGAGILAVPYLASHNSIREVFLMIILCLAFNIVLHLLIAELSLNNDGAQFVSCLDNELFSGPLKKVLTSLAFVLLGLSVLINVTAFLTGASEVFSSWFGWSPWVGKIVFYLVGASVVFFGMKYVGIFENGAVAAIIASVVIIFIVALTGTKYPFQTDFKGVNNALALFGMISFSLSAVMSTPQVVKGLGGDAKRIRKSIILGLVINATLILLITLATIIGAGSNISEDDALVSLAEKFGGVIKVLDYLFTLLALATSFWANSLNLRDIVDEFTHWGRRLSWLVTSIPPLILALLGLSSFVTFTRFASVIQVVTGLGIIVAYHLSRKRVGESRLLGKFGTLPFQILVGACTLLATIGAVLKVQ